MVIPTRRRNCIWCEHPLVNYHPEPWQTWVRRSEEHIIPESIGGRVKTYDLCESCNSEFGRICDYALLKDHRIIEAAAKVGIKLTDLRINFTGIQKTDTGTEVNMRYVGGAFKPEPQLDPRAPLIIPREDWAQLRRHVRGSLIQKVLRKGLPLAQQQVESEIDLLLARVDAEPTQEHRSAVIGEGFRQAISSGDVRTTEEFFPWETEWCLAKIIFELSCVAWPMEYRSYYRPLVAANFRDFLSRREHDQSAKTGKGIFSFTEVAALPVKQHAAHFLLTPTKLECVLNFFGTAQWSWENSVTPITPPPGNGWKLTVNNPTSGKDSSIECHPL